MDERIIQYFNGELQKKERIELLKELDINPMLKNDMLNYQNFEAITSLLPENLDAIAGNEGYKRLMKVRQKKKSFHLIKRSIAYAAVICLIIAFTWTVAMSNRKPAEYIAAHQPNQQELYVPPGQRARITLPDGSVAWLNAGSTLEYPSFFEKERKVNLTGEAYFDVAHNPDMPFIVSTEFMDIEALGTQFDVYSYPKAKSITTTLIHGSVKVYKSGKKSQGTILEPNQKLVYENDKFTLETSIDKDDLLWKEGIYSFKKVRLDFIVKKLELYYDVEIIVKDPRILQYEYTGKFRQRDGIMEILRIIQKIHKFKIDKNDELNQITITG